MLIFYSVVRAELKNYPCFVLFLSILVLYVTSLFGGKSILRRPAILVPRVWNSTQDIFLVDYFWFRILWHSFPTNKYFMYAQALILTLSPLPEVSALSRRLVLYLIPSTLPHRCNKLVQHGTAIWPHERRRFRLLYLPGDVTPPSLWRQGVVRQSEVQTASKPG